jgi:predicted aconitase with swiveling domain
VFEDCAWRIRIIEKREIKGRGVVRGRAQGYALVTTEPVSFFGGLDPRTGRIIEKNHELEGKNVTNRVFVFPHGKGSTVGSYIIYAMKKNGVAPSAVINLETEPIIAAGCVLAEIPLIDKLEVNPLKAIKTGDFVKVLADMNVVEIESDKS